MLGWISKCKSKSSLKGLNYPFPCKFLFTHKLYGGKSHIYVSIKYKNMKKKRREEITIRKERNLATNSYIK
jgi:hypothetical protein